MESTAAPTTAAAGAESDDAAEFGAIVGFIELLLGAFTMLSLSEESSMLPDPWECFLLPLPDPWSWESCDPWESSWESWAPATSWELCEPCAWS